MPKAWKEFCYQMVFFWPSVEIWTIQSQRICNISMTTVICHCCSIRKHIKCFCIHSSVWHNLVTHWNRCSCQQNYQSINQNWQLRTKRCNDNDLVYSILIVWLIVTTSKHTYICIIWVCKMSGFLSSEIILISISGEAQITRIVFSPFQMTDPTCKTE